MAPLQIILAPALAVMAIAFLFNLLMHRFEGSKFREPAFGLMFGGAIILSMSYPIAIGDGIIFDARTLLIGAATAFVGPVSGGIATVMAIGYRVLLGGAGMAAGVVGLVLAFGLSLVFLAWVAPKVRNSLIEDVGHGVFLTLSTVALFMLPWSVATALISKVVPAFTIVYAIGMAILGMAFRREITLYAQRNELQEHATRDPLTNLLNRRGLQAVARHQRYDPKIGQAVLYFDVDNFKGINDNHGHDIGDAVLEVIANRVSENLRAGAIFARQGGDEFSIYMADISEGDIAAIANRICSRVGDTPLAVCDRLVNASISMGGYWSKADHGLDELINRADAQLLLAKQAGKNRAQVAYDPQSTQVAVA